MRDDGQLYLDRRGAVPRTGLPRWLIAKGPPCQCRRHWFDPWVEKIPCRGRWQPSPLFLPGKSHGQRSLAWKIPWTLKKELDMTERLNKQMPRTVRTRAMKLACFLHFWQKMSVMFVSSLIATCNIMSTCMPSLSFTSFNILSHFKISLHICIHMYTHNMCMFYEPLETRL